MPERNWAGTVTFTPANVLEPRSMTELLDVVRTSRNLRALGSRHSFSTIADASTLVSLARMPTDMTLDPGRRCVTVSAGVTYGTLARYLAAKNYAVHNTASLPHITIGGAISTATHGSGSGNRNLAGPVLAVELVTGDGDVRLVNRDDPLFPAVVVGLGATGIITRVTLEVEPSFQVRQRVYEDLPWEALWEDLDGVFASGYSVSVFTTWDSVCERLWVKSRVESDAEVVRDHLYGARAATTELHPTRGLSAENCSAQLGAPGVWSERLPHFRPDFTPSNGEEIQSEFLIPRGEAVAAINTVRSLRSVLKPVLQVSEIRTIAADDLWMSPQYEQDTVAIHFTWVRDPERVQAVLGQLEKELQPFDARPHWGKMFLAEASDIRALYPKSQDFISVIEALDPRGIFTNAWLARHVLGEGVHPRPKDRIAHYAD